MEPVAMGLLQRVGFACAALLGVACTSSRSVAPPGLSAARPIHLDVVATWRVLDGGEFVGIVLQYASDPTVNGVRSSYFSVQDRLRHELGRVDGLGRAWRFEPHAREPRWVATGTVLEGVREILSTSEAATLAESSSRDVRAP